LFNFCESYNLDEIGLGTVLREYHSFMSN